MLTWIYDQSYETLKEDITSMNMPSFVAGQVFQWLYEKNNSDTGSWSNISKVNRDILAKKYDTSPNQVLEIKKDQAGTRKFLFSLHDGHKIESVLINEKNHFTLCISTQVGCALKCKFCATGTMGLKRNLSPGEILCQVLQLKKYIDQPGKEEKTKINIVFMGMGEPLLNYGNLKKALTIITAADGTGIGISPRNITVSTAGILKEIERLENDFPNLKISFSLNAADEQARETLMPISAREKLTDILFYFRHNPRKHRITFEYVLLKGVNDTLQDAAKIARLLRGIPCKINLIPYNENETLEFKTPDKENVEIFCEYLHDRGYTVITRWSRGKDIQSACGQLVTGDRLRVKGKE